MKDIAYLAPYQEQNVKVVPRIVELEAWAVGRPDQSARAAAVRRVVEQTIVEVVETIRAVQNSENGLGLSRSNESQQAVDCLGSGAGGGHARRRPGVARAAGRSRGIDCGSDNLYMFGNVAGCLVVGIAMLAVALDTAGRKQAEERLYAVHRDLEESNDKLRNENQERHLAQQAARRAEDEVRLLNDGLPDDEQPTLRALAKNKIQNTVIAARDGAEALDYLFGTGKHIGRNISVMPQVILLDLKLPKVDGLEV